MAFCLSLSLEFRECFLNGVVSVIVMYINIINELVHSKLIYFVQVASIMPYICIPQTAKVY